MSWIPIAFLAAVALGGGRRKKSAPEPDDVEVVLCDIDPGDVMLPSGTVGTLVDAYYAAPASAWGASVAPQGLLRPWAAEGAISTVLVIGGKSASRWPACWGGGDAPPPGWTRLEWLAIMSTRDTIVRVRDGVGLQEPIPALFAQSPAGIAGGLANLTPSSLREIATSAPVVVVEDLRGAIAAVLYQGAKALLAEHLV